jgi:hypothetical protein
MATLGAGDVVTTRMVVEEVLMVITTLKVEATITIRMVTTNVIIFATTFMEGDISVVIVVAMLAFPGVLTVEVPGEVLVAVVAILETVEVVLFVVEAASSSQ